MSILLLRHGPTAYNTGDSQERLRSWLDLPLSEEGERVAIAAAEQLAPIPVERILSSDLRRSRDTAEVWAARIAKSLTLHRELRPWHLGDLAGQTVAVTQPIMDKLVDTPTIPAPNGESLNDFLDRYLPFIMPLVRDTARYGIVSHIRNIKALQAHLTAVNGRINLTTWRQSFLIGPGQAIYITVDDCKKLDKQLASAAH
jgi:probable phosphoglycerate mutase